MNRSIRRTVFATLVALASLAIAASAASAAVIYDNIPATLPGNLPSVGFEATQTSEFGGQVSFAGIARNKASVIVTMSSWACQKGNWTWPSSGELCVSHVGATFAQPVTLNVYEVAAENKPGALVGSVTQTFNMPYRPTASTKCSGQYAGKWLHNGTCFNGKAFKITFANIPFALPSQNAIVSVAYNTSNYGVEPQGSKPCNSEGAGCPYDSLNVAVREKGEAGPTVGSDPDPSDAYLNSTTADYYCGNLAGVNTFALSTGCWAEEQPAIEVTKAVK